MNDDATLLRRFAEEHSEPAFRELVERRIGLVYAAALRQVGGDAHLAQEVTQGVFLDLARKARSLAGHGLLTGWLYTSVRFAAAKALRSRMRRLNHETEAHAMQETLSAAAAPDPDWNELRPVLDAAMHELGERDRAAILLRYFEGRSLAEVGAAIGLAENSARMRVDRALEKLRGRLASRGITSTAAALGALLAAQPAAAVPAGLAASTASAGLAMLTIGGGSAGVALGVLNFMNWTKMTMGAAAAFAMVGLGTWIGARSVESPAGPFSVASARPAEGNAAALRAENDRLRSELTRTRGGSGAAATSAVSAGSAAAQTPVIEALRVVLDLKRRKLMTPELNLLGERKITDEFTELFGLSPTEREALQAALAAAGGRLAVLEKENTTVTRTPDGGVAIATKAFPEAGGAVYDAMLKTFADTLGPERYTAFLALGAEQSEKALGRFGTAHQAATFSRDVDPDGQVWYHVNHRSSVTPQDNSTYRSDRLSREEFLKHAGAIIDLELLPKDFLEPRK